MSEPTTSPLDHEVSTAEAIETDTTEPGPSDGEQQWGADEAVSAASMPIPSNFDWSAPGALAEVFDERKVTRMWTAARRWGWDKAKYCLRPITELLARVVGRRNFDRFDVVYATPPESQVYTTVGLRINLPSVDDRYEDLPPDPFPPASTNISQIIGVPYTFVDLQSSLTDMLDVLGTSISEAVVPCLSMDVEGLDLGKRKGRTYLLKIYDSHSHHLCMVDVLTLRRPTFSTKASDGGTSLRMILQSADVTKLFCDVRADSYALFKRFRIYLHGVKDLQLMQIASRRDPSCTNDGPVWPP
jgi:hypothetical protein